MAARRICDESPYFSSAGKLVTGWRVLRVSCGLSMFEAGSGTWLRRHLCHSHLRRYFLATCSCLPITNHLQARYRPTLSGRASSCVQAVNAW